MDIKLFQKENKPYTKNDDHLKGLLNTVKISRDHIRMQFYMDKCTKETFRKSAPVKSKNIILDINMEIVYHIGRKLDTIV